MVSMICFLKLYAIHYKKILITAVMSLLLCFFGLKSITYLIQRESLIEPFTLGVVVEDKSQYIDLLTKMLMERNDLQKTLIFALLTKEEADLSIRGGKMPCYILIPKGFTNSIMTGENKDVIFVGSRDHLLQYKISETLVKAGVAFLTSSQSGIYSTIDYATEHHIDPTLINEKIVWDINMAFGTALISYKDYFDLQVVGSDTQLPRKDFYLQSFLLFFMLVISISFYQGLQSIFQKGVTERLMLCGVTPWKRIWFVYGSMYLFCSLLFLPLSCFFGLKIFLVTLSITSIIVPLSLLFQDETAFGVTLFSLSLVMLFVSGGLIPNGLLPEIVKSFGVITIPHYLLVQRMTIIGFGYCAVLFILSFFVSLFVGNRKVAQQ